MPAYLKAILEQLIVKVTAGMAGAQAFAVAWLMRLGGQFLWDNYQVLQKKFERWREQSAAKKKYDEVMKNPEASPEERDKAYEEYINSGN